MVFARVNEAGGIVEPSGRRRTIKVAVRDDGYDAVRTVPLVDELIASRSAFALWTYGSPNALATYDSANLACVPQPLVVSNLPAFGDPVAHPWTTGHGLPHSAEAAMWVAYIEQHFSELSAGDGRVQVGVVAITTVPGNDFGAAYLNGFRAALERSSVADLVDVNVSISDLMAEQFNGPQERAMSPPPDIFIAMVGGVSCAVTVAGVVELGLRATRTPAFVTSLCAAPRNFLAKESLDRPVWADGWLAFGTGLRDVTAPAADDPFARWLLAAADAAALRVSPHLVPGAAHGWTWAQALQIAAELDGGLTRTNLIVALRAMDMTHPLVTDGVRFAMAGNADAFPIEGAGLFRFDAAAQAWTPTGTVFDLAGRTPNCTWSGSTPARPNPPGERLADPCAAGGE